MYEAVKEMKTNQEQNLISLGEAKEEKKKITGKLIIFECSV